MALFTVIINRWDVRQNALHPQGATMRLNKALYLENISEPEVCRLLADCKAANPDAGVLALLPESEKNAAPVLQSAANSQEVPLVGAIFPALVKDDAFLTAGAWLICFDKMPETWLYADLTPDPSETAKFVDAFADEFSEYLDTFEDEDDITLFMLFDPLVSNIGTILDAFYGRLADRVNYLGANGGSETFQPMPCLFDNYKIVSNGMLAMALLDHKGGILEHGYKEPEKIIHATSTQVNCITNIDWKPAFEVYSSFMLEEYKVEITRENFYEHSSHFPFGIMRANHSIVVRIPVALSDNGSLFCVGEVPPNSLLTLLRAADASSVHTIETLYKGLCSISSAAELDGSSLLLFFCAGRYMHLGEDAAIKELSNFKAMTKAAQVVGAKSLGEIGPSAHRGSYPVFHNAVLVAACL
jgi:hypothetical protein